MTVVSAEMGVETEAGGAMAWVGFAIGALIAMVLAILAHKFLTLPIWMVLLIYPVLGTVIALAVIAIMLLLSDDMDDDR